MSTIKASKLKPGVYYVPRTEDIVVIENPRIQTWINTETLKTSLWETATIQSSFFGRTENVRIEGIEELVWIGKL